MASAGSDNLGASIRLDRHNDNSNQNNKGVNEMKTINKDGTPRKKCEPYFCKGSKTKMILDHLQAGGTLTQMQCYPPSKFNTIRLGGIIGELRERGYDIKTEMINNPSGTKHGRYSMEVK